MKNNLLPGLHSLRGIAALMIVFFHVAGIPPLELPKGWTFINNYFGMGVPMFFVISAFSLFLSTYKKLGNPEKLSPRNISGLRIFSVRYHDFAADCTTGSFDLFIYRITRHQYGKVAH